jgi:hypothetical protein
MLLLVLSSDSHVFEPPDLWQARIDAPFRDRALRIERIDGADQIVVEADQILSGIGPISTPAQIEETERLIDVYRYANELRGWTMASCTRPRLREESSQTHPGREMDSNFRYRLREATV